MTTPIDSYGKMPTFGSRHFNEKVLAAYHVDIEEKMDGSQFSFMKSPGGAILARSRKTVFNVNDQLFEELPPNSLFYKTLKTVQRVGPQLPTGWTFRGEAMKGPRHNALEYGREPEGNFVLWDIVDNWGGIRSRLFLEAMAKRFSFEVTPLLAVSNPTKPWTKEQLIALTEGQSFLGGRREGIVLKVRYGGVYLKAKLVSPSFKEKSGRKKSKQPQVNPIADICDQLTTEARYRKAYQRVRENLDVEFLEPKHIGPCMKVLAEDLELEEQGWIKEQLWDAYQKKITKQVSNGFPHWLKSGGFERGLDSKTPH